MLAPKCLPAKRRGGFAVRFTKTLFIFLGKSGIEEDQVIERRLCRVVNSIGQLVSLSRDTQIS